MRQYGERIVAVWGTFDIVHAGHVHFLKAARSEGTRLCAVVIPDEQVRENKGTAPIRTTEERCRALLNTGLVDEVLIDSMSAGLRCLIERQPDVFCLGYDQATEWEVELRSFLAAHLPSCRLQILPMFANGIHSRHLKAAPITSPYTS
jgi:cytidyltransferase-like protein